MIDAALKTDAVRPRALFERFGIELIATTESPLDPLEHHRTIRESGWTGRVVTAYRPDPVVDTEGARFAANVRAFCAAADADAGSWDGYLAAHRFHRARFRMAGATSTDHDRRMDALAGGLGRRWRTHRDRRSGRRPPGAARGVEGYLPVPAMVPDAATCATIVDQLGLLERSGARGAIHRLLGETSTCG